MAGDFFVRTGLFTNVELTATTGKIVDTSSSTYTTVHGSQGNVSSYNTTYKTVFLIDEKGLETTFTFGSWAPAARPGNIVSVIFARKWKKSFPIMVKNHDTGQSSFEDKLGSKVYSRISGALIVAAPWIVLVIAAFVATEATNDLSQSHSNEILGVFWGAPVVAMFWYAIGRSIAKALLKNSTALRTLLELCDQNAAQVRATSVPAE